MNIYSILYLHFAGHCMDTGKDVWNSMFMGLTDYAK